MKLVRLAGAALTVALLILWTACGNYYRPVAFPLTPSPPSPGFSHMAIVLSVNGANNPGASTTIDVSGDSAVSQSTLGLRPAYAALVDNATKVFVANSGDDTVSEFSPDLAIPVVTIALPTGSVPNFVASTELTTVYVSNSGNGTVSSISTATNSVTNTSSVGGSPFSMVELSDSQKVYVANTSTATSAGSVVSVNTIDLSVNPPIVASAAAPWVSPTWIVSRSDGQRVYVLDKGSGFVSAIDTDFDTVVGTPAAVGIGADYMSYDPILDRLYVTNPVTNSVVVLDASSDTLPATTVSVPNAVSVAALPDGTRAYVASGAVSGTTVSSSVTVLYAGNLSVKTVIPLTSVPVVCATKTATELSTAAAADSTRVYVGNCDAGNTTIIQTSDDTVVLDLPAPLAGPLAHPTTTPPPQNPVLVIAGP
jgi:YVTN family beta-propeller protein